MLALFSLQFLSCWPVCCPVCSKLLGSMASPQLQWSLAPALRTESSSKRPGFCPVCSPSCCAVLCCAGVCCTQALLPDAWPDMLRTLAAFLCPFRAMMQQRQQEAMAAAAAAAAAASAAAAGGGGSGAGVAPLRTAGAAGAAVPSTPQTAGSLGGARSFNRCVGLVDGFVMLSCVRPVIASFSRAASASASRGATVGRCVAADGLFAVCGLPRLLRDPPSTPPSSTGRLFSARPGGPVPAAATDAAQLTTQLMGKVTKRLVELYAHAPWQVCVRAEYCAAGPVPFEAWGSGAPLYSHAHGHVASRAGAEVGV